jgi:hypothetical protein
MKEFKGLGNDYAFRESLKKVVAAKNEEKDVDNQVAATEDVERDKVAEADPDNVQKEEDEKREEQTSEEEKEETF